MDERKREKYRRCIGTQEQKTTQRAAPVTLQGGSLLCDQESVVASNFLTHFTSQETACTPHKKVMNGKRASRQQVTMST